MAAQSRLLPAAEIVPAENDQSEHSALAVAHGRVGNRDQLAFGIDFRPPSLAAVGHAIADAHVAVGATHHDVMVSAAADIAVEGRGLHSNRLKILSRRDYPGGFPRRARRDPCSGCRHRRRARACLPHAAPSQIQHHWSRKMAARQCRSKRLSQSNNTPRFASSMDSQLAFTRGLGLRCADEDFRSDVRRTTASTSASSGQRSRRKTGTPLASFAIGSRSISIVMRPASAKATTSAGEQR